MKKYIKIVCREFENPNSLNNYINTLTKVYFRRGGPHKFTYAIEFNLEHGTMEDVINLLSNDLPDCSILEISYEDFVRI